jgi:prephenate dehydrogenase
VIETVSIVGTGLIGASFGLALRRAGFAGHILGVSSPAALGDALACGAVDAGATLEEAVAAADLVYLAQPIVRIVETIGRMAPLVRETALVTDAGSTKRRIVEAGGAIRRGQFLGGHPMAGKEKRGAAAAEASLFQGRTYILTPCDPAELETAVAREFRRWVGRIGAVELVLDPEEHDRVVAFTSHLPQLLSTGLGATLARSLPSLEHLRAAGPGLVDMTRLAGSSYELWRDILDTNREAIEAALGAYIEELGSLRNGLAGDTISEAFASANALAGHLRRPG